MTGATYRFNKSAIEPTYNAAGAFVGGFKATLSSTFAPSTNTAHVDNVAALADMLEWEAARYLTAHPDAPGVYVSWQCLGRNVRGAGQMAPGKAFDRAAVARKLRTLRTITGATPVGRGVTDAIAAAVTE